MRLPAAETAPPSRIGPYRILQQVGEGGMGVVYMAEQESPVRRKVALKVIKLGMDTARVVLRFESERQALALMNHPAIARVFDAGATEQGRLYFAMEYVQGVPITEYCDRNRLTTRERLGLFVRVCEGVQHAHMKGVIHRDIKPSNVLVTDEDGKHNPKIIDFGIAKATAQRLTEGTLFTEMGQLLGTPEYMSPEQAEMSGLDIDTRTDVYLLGVLLYETLTGELPFDAASIRQSGFDEFRRMILEDEPRRPSTRFTPVTERALQAAKNRRDEPRALARELSGDLDWITMKALEKNRTRRYASAADFAADIGRYLRCEPVLASPPSKLYRVRKFARRHRTGVGFSAVVLLLLIGFGVALTLAAQRIVHEGERAAVERDRANEALVRADHEANSARVVSNFLVDLFQESDPDKTRGATVTAREILDRGSKRVESTLVDQPRVQARLLHTMGDAYQKLGLSDQARQLLETALEAQRRIDPGDLDYANTLDLLAGVLVNYGEWDRARLYYRDALAIRRNRLPADHSDIAGTLNKLANIQQAQGEIEEADQLFDEAFAIWERTLPADDPQRAIMLNNRAVKLQRNGELDAARALFERALEIRIANFGERSSTVARGKANLGRLLEAQGDLAGALVYYEQALHIRDEMYGDDNLTVGRNLMDLSMLNLRLDRRDVAQEQRERALRIFERAQGLENPYVHYQLASYAALSGATDEALRHLQGAIERGFSDLDTLEQDPNLAALRATPGFARVARLAGASGRQGSRKPGG